MKTSNSRAPASSSANPFELAANFRPLCSFRDLSKELYRRIETSQGDTRLMKRF